jgi:hypothetical protein
MKIRTVKIALLTIVLMVVSMSVMAQDKPLSVKVEMPESTRTATFALG